MSFPPITPLEAAFFGEALLEDVDELVAIWNEAEDRLRLLIRDPQFLSATNIAASVQRSQELLRDVNLELARLREQTIAWTRSSVPTHVAQGSSAAVEAAAAQGGQFVAGGALGVANTQAIRVISEDILADMEFSISSAQRTMRRSFRATQQTLVTEAAINEALLISESRLENADQRGRRLQSLFEKNSLDGKFINVGGRFFHMNTYADIIARTRLTEATVEGSFQAVLAMGIDTVRISDHGRTDKFCDPFAGKTYSISGRDKRFPRLRQRPPFHPRCRHALLPFVPELKDETELGFAVAVSNDRIPVDMTFEEFARAGA